MDAPRQKGAPSEDILPGAFSLSENIPAGDLLSEDILRRATVPEHSVDFMRAMSGGAPFCEGDFLFFSADDWLMAIGYPLARTDVKNAARDDFDAALRRAVERSGARSCWAIAPRLPNRLRNHIEDSDRFYLLPLEQSGFQGEASGSGPILEPACGPDGTSGLSPGCASVPSSLRRAVRRAAKELRVTEDREFSPAHRRLWAEFLDRTRMRPNVRALYARTEAVLAAAGASGASFPGSGPDSGPGRKGGNIRAAPDLRLLNAWDKSGNLAAALLIDYSPVHFCSYIIGAHSRVGYAPHASDLLFAELLERGRAAGKGFIHLGLGVNEGITRFKRKWGGHAGQDYEMAAWKEPGRQPRSTGGLGPRRAEITRAMHSMLRSPAELSKRQMFENLPKQRPFGMIWKVRKGEAVSYLCGTAHFFCYSFEFAFRELFARLDTIIFEGPLEEDFLAKVEKAGRSPEADAPCLAAAFSEEEIARIERVIYGPEGHIPRFFGLEQPRRVNVRHLLAHTRPWFAFFSLWAAFLERRGWTQSVDLEAWHTAKDMGKAVIGMENLAEQLDSLEVIPQARIVDFFRRCRSWPACMKRNISAYLNGDLEAMMGSSIEFPSRTEQVINRRDQRFRMRMRPFLEAGSCAVFVGSAHLIGLRPMLEEDGFRVTPCYPGLYLKLRALAGRLLSGCRQNSVLPF